MKPIRFGLIGYGAWGAHHARAIAGNPQACLAAIAVRSDASQKAARDAHRSAKIYGDYRAMLATESLDVVAVVLPKHIRRLCALSAAKLAADAASGALGPLSEGSRLRL